MKYTKQQRKDLHKVFKAAQPYLTTYVCFAIDRAEYEGVITREQANLAIDLIDHRITPCATVVQWLGTQGIDASDEDEAETYRKRWLAALVKEFEK